MGSVPQPAKRSWTAYIPRPGSSSGRPGSSSGRPGSSGTGRPGSSGSIASHIITAIRNNDSGISPPIFEGQELSGSPLTLSATTTTPPVTLDSPSRSVPEPAKRRWTAHIPRPRSSSGRPGSSGSIASTIITAIRSNNSDISPPIFEGQEPSDSLLTPPPVTLDSPSCSVPEPAKRRWTNYIPRPGSSSGRPGSSSGRPGSSGSIASTIITAIRNNNSDISPPISEGQEPSDSLLTPPPVTLDSPPPLRPTKRRSTNFLLTSSPKAPPQVLDQQASQLILNALERTNSQQLSQGSVKSPDSTKNAFGKSFTSMMGGLSSLTRTTTRDSANEDKDKDRGRSMLKMNRSKSASQAPADEEQHSRSISRPRSQSPFSFRRYRNREQSPAPQPVRLSQSDADLSDAPSSIHPRTTAFTDDDSDEGGDAETDDASSSGDERCFDTITERNTERNALTTPVLHDVAGAAPEIEDPDPVGEGVNVIIAPEPYFPSSLNSSLSRGKRNPRRRKSVKTHEPLPFNTSRPVFQRDRCTITITQGNPEGTLGARRKRRYVVASDLSEESRYAVEWGVGTVLRDGDEMLIVTVVENEAKVDPASPNTSDRTVKLRSQQERQGLAYILVRQVTGLLQRTRLNVTISCQAWHAKNSRHMLLDIVDHIEPTMLIVGSRGLGQLNGILLGSTSHYLIQKCSVPVMVARRRLKRPPKKSAHLSTRRPHVSLAEAGIDRVAAKVDEDVQVMRDEIQKDDIRRDGGPGSRENGHFNSVPEDGDGEDEGDDDGDDGDKDDEPGVKVAG